MIEPYFSFNGQAREAMEFYEKVFGGTNISIFKFSDMVQNHENPIPEHMKGWVGHGEMTICGTIVNFGDFLEPTVSPGDSLTLMIRFNTADEVTEIFNKLVSDGGTALMELSPQFYAKLFGWVKDKYEIGWQLICEN